MSVLIPTQVAAQLEAGRRQSNLALALIVLPRDRRADSLTFYRFCRLVDDVADTDLLDPAEKDRCLQEWLSALDDPLLQELPADLRELIQRHDLDRNLFREIVLGVHSDLERRRYDTLVDLLGYCWRVASAVGLISAKLFGSTHPSTPAYAEALGTALQLTNILRDVGEDAGLQRIYLPRELLDRHGVSESEILTRKLSRPFRAAAEDFAHHADEYYETAQRSFPREDSVALRPAEIMRTIYQRTLRKIRDRNYDVFSERISLPRWQKLWIALSLRS